MRGLGLSVTKGSVTVLLGSNGAGKSSTLNAIAGLAVPRGRIEFEGSRIDGQAPEDIVRKGIALCPEGRRVFPSLSVAENLHLGGAVHAKGEALAARIEAELTRFPILRERYHQKAGLLSGGEQQMLAIARALMSAPPASFAGRAVTGSCPQSRRSGVRPDPHASGPGITILLVEQNAERALEIADQGYVLQSGELVLSGTGGELAQSDLIRQAYLAG